MAVCSFLGHRELYDADIESRLQSAVDQVAEENETVDFLLYSVNEKFFYYCLLAAQRVRKRYPEKVTLTLVLHQEHYAQYLQQKRSDVPAYIADRVIVPQLPSTKSKSPATPYMQMLRWLAQNSTHLISYIYDKLYDFDTRFLNGHSTFKNINIANPDTEQAILNSVMLMSDKEQSIFQAMNDGCTLKEAGQLLGVGQERARQLLQHGCSKLRHNLSIRYSKELRITAVIGDDLSLGSSNGQDITESFCPPCDAVECIGHAETAAEVDALNVIYDMIEKSNFCICDLSAAADADRIRKYIRQAKHAVLFDISELNSYTGKGTAKQAVHIDR